MNVWLERKRDREVSQRVTKLMDDAMAVYQVGRSEPDEEKPTLSVRQVHEARKLEKAGKTACEWRELTFSTCTEPTDPNCRVKRGSEITVDAEFMSALNDMSKDMYKDLSARIDKLGCEMMGPDTESIVLDQGYIAQLVDWKGPPSPADLNITVTAGSAQVTEWVGDRIECAGAGNPEIASWSFDSLIQGHSPEDVKVVSVDTVNFARGHDSSGREWLVTTPEIVSIHDARTATIAG